MARSTWTAIVVLSATAFIFMAMTGFSLSFAPGWANGWPFGLTIQAVWSTGMAVVVFLLLMTAAVGVGAAVGALYAEPSSEGRRGRAVYAVWLLGCAIGALGMSVYTFTAIYDETWRMWPNGYNP
jgi:hypothetical protein